MEQRENALREALTRNAEETTRWETYQKDNEQAIENLESFSKHLVVNVMVPVGRKAYTAGQLFHTNEVMVSHYQGYFSKCSSHTAKQICHRRIQMAKEQLEKLKTEAKLWNNNLEKPYLDGVLPSAKQRDIVEEYDDEKEKLWREQHKLSVKQAKLREREARKKAEETIEEVPDVQRMFDEAVQMEELRAELDSLQVDEGVDTDEIIRKLLSGEIKMPPPKPRVAFSAEGEEVKFDMNRLTGIVKKTDLKADYIPPTNNNFRVNPELLLQETAVEGVTDDGNESDDSAASEVPEEVKLIEDQAKFLPVGDQIGFYQYQLQIIAGKLFSSPVSNPTDIEHKLHLFKMREHLEDLLEAAEEAEGALELAAAEKEIGDDDETAVTAPPTDAACENTSNQQPKNKRITFALEDHTLEFRKTETVAEMLPKPDAPPPLRRDIITLDDPTFSICAKSAEQHSQSLTKVDKKEMILNKVEEHLKYVAEQQSVRDFDLVNKIIEDSTHTLHIYFKHSSQTSSEAEPEPDTDGTSTKIPRSPADLYRMFVQNCDASLDEPQQQPRSLFIDAYEGEDQVKVPILKEQDRQTAYKDLRMEFSKPSGDLKSVSKPGVSLLKPSLLSADQSTRVTKSIIKNKKAVEAETHLVNVEINKKKKKKPPPTQKSPNDEKYMTAYDKVMTDVVEKPSPEPESLPAGKYIDTFAPKKRISRFKQMRSGVQTT